MELSERKNKYRYGVLSPVVLAEILLYLPIDDLLRLENLLPHADLYKLVLIPLLSFPNQRQFPFRFSEDLERVLSKPQLQKVRFNTTGILNFCSELKSWCDRNHSEISSIVPIGASTDDGVSQNIDKTLIRSKRNFWSSNPGEKQDKEDWLFYDLGDVMLIDRIGIAAWKSYFEGRPIFSFETIWIQLFITRDRFHFQTKILSGSPGDEMQYFHPSHSGALLSARYIKIYMKGCTKRCYNNKWYFTVRSFRVWGTPISQVFKASSKSKEELQLLEEEMRLLEKDFNAL